MNAAPWDGGGMVAATEVEPMLRRGVPLIKPEPAMLALQQALEATGRYEVKCEHDAGKAVAVAEEFRPDLIVMDVVMPKIDVASPVFIGRQHRHRDFEPLDQGLHV